MNDDSISLNANVELVPALSVKIVDREQPKFGLSDRR
jgi:hypothetical protein